MSRMITQSTMTANGVDLRTPKLPEPPKRITPGELPHHITVACVWHRSKTYGVEYVERLYNMVKRHCPITFTFVCITPHQKLPDGVIRMPPPLPPFERSVASTEEKNWWQKVGLFSPNLFGPSMRVLYLDLDVVIVNSLEEILRADDPFCMIENFGPNKGHAAHNSSVMLWTPSDKTAEIFNKFDASIPAQLHGDQCWIWRVMQDENIRDFERHQCISFKYERAQQQWRHRTKETSVIVFHGRPKPHDCKDKEVALHWI